MPISEPSPITQPSSIAMWPTVTLAPTIVGRSSAQWMTQLSCTLEPAPITIALLSPRSTAPNQIDAPASTVDVADQDRGRRDERVLARPAGSCRRARSSSPPRLLDRLLVLVGADQQALGEPFGDHPALQVHVARPATAAAWPPRRPAASARASARRDRARRRDRRPRRPR